MRYNNNIFIVYLLYYSCILVGSFTTTTLPFSLSLIQHQRRKHGTVARNTFTSLIILKQANNVFDDDDENIINKKVVEEEEEEKEFDKNYNIDNQRRRQLILSSISSLFVTTLKPSESTARGLVQFPCNNNLANKYHFLRAGTSMLEEEGIYSTNPLFLTFRDDALSIAGQEQIVQVCKQYLSDPKYAPTLVKYSLAARCIDTANIISTEIQIGREKLVPEFTFMDPRGIGGWDMSNITYTSAAIYALDNDEAGRDGINGRPPSNDDGTPHEVLADQVIRLRQIFSILESQYTGETILMIFPDGTGPALLSAMIAGIPYNRIHELEYNPGEIRLDVTKESTLALWNEKQVTNLKNYELLLEEGRQNLQSLRTNGLPTNLKDKRIENERIKIDKAYEDKQQQRKLMSEKEYEARIQRQQEIQNNSDNNNNSPVSPEILGAAMVGGVGIIAGVSGVGAGNTTTTTTTTNDDNNNLLQQSSLLSGVDAELTGATANNNSTTSTTEVRFTNDTTEEPMLAKQQWVNGDKNGSFQQQEEEILDPKVAAEKAMEEYMNRDDGGTDWLLSLAEIIQEDDEESYQLANNDTSSTSKNDNFQ